MRENGVDFVCRTLTFSLISVSCFQHVPSISSLPYSLIISLISTHLIDSKCFPENVPIRLAGISPLNILMDTFCFTFIQVLFKTTNFIEIPWAVFDIRRQWHFENVEGKTRSLEVALLVYFELSLKNGQGNLAQTCCFE